MGRSSLHSSGCTLLSCEDHVGETGLFLLVLHEAQGPQRGVLCISLLQVLKGSQRATEAACACAGTQYTTYGDTLMLPVGDQWKGEGLRSGWGLVGGTRRRDQWGGTT